MYRENEESNKSISRYIPDVPNPVIVIDSGHGGKIQSCRGDGKWHSV